MRRRTNQRTHVDFYAARYRVGGWVGVPLTGEIIDLGGNIADLVTAVVARDPSLPGDKWAVYFIELGAAISFGKTRKAAIEYARGVAKMGAARTRVERHCAMGDVLKDWQP